MARGRVYKVYGSITASADAVAYVTIQRNCTLRGLLITMSPSALTSADHLQLEVSTSAARQLTTNDTQGPLAGHNWYGTLTTSGTLQAPEPLAINMDYDLKEGDRIYIHATEAGAATWTVNVYLYVTETGRR